MRGSHFADQGRTTTSTSISAADVLVLPSQYDNWGLVVNEALAFGCRVLVSERCGAAELVLGRPRAGAVLPVGDVSAWAAAMLACRDHLHRVPVAPYDPTADMVADLRSLGRCGDGASREGRAAA